MVAYVLIEYSTNKFLGELKGGGVPPDPSANKNRVVLRGFKLISLYVMLKHSSHIMYLLR